MSYLLNNQQKFNDVVFENRNKAYGAYAIRSAYGNTVFKSLLLITLSSCSIASIAYFLNKKTEDPKNKVLIGQIPETEIFVNLKRDEPNPVTEDHKPAKPDPARPAAAGLGSVIIDSLAETTHTQTIEDVPSFPSAATGSTGIAGIPDTGGSGQTTGTLDGGTAGHGDQIEDPFGVDSQPEFEGGLKALYRFVSSRLQYPEAAADVGKEGTVYVKFVVDEKGSVGSLTLQNNLGYGLDDEARRVVALIPNFKTPAKVKGKAVKVYYQLPIRFKLR